MCGRNEERQKGYLCLSALSAKHGRCHFESCGRAETLHALTCNHQHKFKKRSQTRHKKCLRIKSLTAIHEWSVADRRGRTILRSRKSQFRNGGRTGSGGETVEGTESADAGLSRECSRNRTSGRRLPIKPKGVYPTKPSEFAGEAIFHKA